MNAVDRTIAPEIKQVEHFSIVQPERQVMGNGMPLYVIAAGSEDVVRFDLVIRGGQLHQTQPLQAVLTNRMLREGTSGMTSVEIAEKLDYYGAWLDLSSSVNCGVVTLYSLGKYFSKTIEVLASIVKEPVFPEKELEVVIDVNRHQYMVNNQRVEVLSRKQLNRSLFGEQHPLGRYAELKDYDAISPEVLKAFYVKHYHSRNCSAYVSGKISPEVIRCIEEHFGNATWGEPADLSEAKRFALNTDLTKRIFIEKKDAMQSSLKIGGFSLPRQHADYLKLRVLITLFGGYFGSRLMSNIREDKGYTYGIGAGIVSYPETGVLIVSTETANEYVDSVIAEVYNEMDRLCEERVPEKELAMVRNYMLGDMCRSYESAFSLADAWIFIETAGLDNAFFDRSLSAIRNITSDDLLNLAQRYFCKENLIEIVAGKKI